MDTDDLVQETYARVLRARGKGYTFDSKRYIYSTARNAALDFFRHERVVTISRLPQLELLPVSDGRPDPAESACRQDELAILEEAILSLPERCRKVLVCRKLFGLSQKEIAAKLGISENTVSTQVSNGMKRCILFFRNRRSPGRAQACGRRAESETPVQE
jgi:RNA polymerase sigma-70 factor (ECF subfamily)